MDEIYQQAYEELLEELGEEPSVEQIEQKLTDLFCEETDRAMTYAEMER